MVLVFMVTNYTVNCEQRHAKKERVVVNGVPSISLKFMFTVLSELIALLLFASRSSLGLFLLESYLVDLLCSCC